MVPVVAIVGRPNVGKSTLFNRLTRTQDALMSAVSGTTRDRQFGEVKLDGHRFIIIDTGGITKQGDEIETLINQQSLQAIQEADRVIFLIDGKAGVTPDDVIISKQLRKLNKSVVLVINKTEGMQPEESVLDAYELGISPAIPISAVHGRGIGELLRALFPNPIKSEEDTSESSALCLAIVGRPNVGKSTLTNRILGEERVIVHDSPGTTRDSIYIPLERFDKSYILIDTAGVRRRKNITLLPEKFSIIKTLQAIEKANVVLYIIDARLGVSEQDLKLLGFIVECGRGLVIGINKWDGMEEADRDRVRAEIDRQLDFVKFARIHFISALHGSGVGNLFTSVDEAYASACKKLTTSVLTKLLQKALITHTPPLVRGRRIKPRYAHAGGHNPPRIIIHGNQLDSLPDSYKRFLIHFFQTRLKLYGTPVVIEFKTSENPYVKKK